MNNLDVSYANPSLAYLLILVPMLLWLFWRLFSYRQEFQALNPNSRLFHQRSFPIYWLKTFAFCLAWVCLVLSIMGPRGHGRYPDQQAKKEQQGPITIQRKPHEIIFLFDTSSSMAVKDARLGKSRLESAKEIGDEIVQRMQGQSIALNAFTSDLTPLLPSSMDYVFFRLVMKQMQLNEGDIAGTDLLKALEGTKQQFDRLPESVLKTLVILSDGGDTALEASDGSAKSQRMEAVVNALKDLKNFQIYTIGVGSLEGGTVPDVTFQGQAVKSALNQELLVKLSEGKGRYYFANDLPASDIARSMMDTINKQIGGLGEDETVKGSEEESLIYDLYFQIPLGLAIFFLLFCYLYPDARLSGQSLKVSLGLAFLLGSLPLHAASLDEQMRQAVVYEEAGMHNQAFETYKNLAFLPLAEWQKEILEYNMGTTLLEAGQYGEALSQFLAIAPDSSSNKLLQYRTKFNIALAYYYLGIRQAKVFSSNPSLNSISDALFNAKESVKNLDRARAYFCKFKKEEGERDCPENEKIKALQAKAEQLLHWSSLQQRSYLGIHPSEMLSGSPLAILEEAIRQQEKALELHKSSVSNSSLEDYLVKAQEETLTISSSFIPSVINQQIEEYKKEKCQAQPWDEALPLFGQGNEAAAEAKMLLEKDKANPLAYSKSVKKLQEKALLYWQRALEKLKNKDKPSEAKETDKSSEQQIEQQAQKKEELNKVMQNIQEMYMEDAQSKEQHPAIQQVERPW